MNAVPRVLIVEGPDAGKQMEFATVPAKCVIGRSESADLVLVDADASREHAEILRDLDGF